MTKNRLAAVLGGLLCATQLQAQTSACEPFTPEDAPTPLSIGRIIIEANDVFDQARSDEQNFLHRLGNRLHKQSRTSTIEQQLLFKRGDGYSAEIISESERLLRTNDYLKSATITATERCGNEVNIFVQTRDHWSLIPKISFSRRGGENLFGFEVTEANLLGLGKELAVAFQQGNVRDQKILEYKDRHVLGSRTQLTLQWQDNTDGERQLADIKQPFYALNSTAAWRVAADHKVFKTRLYRDREVVTLFALDKRFVDVNIGRSRGLQAGKLHRYWLGARLEETQLSDVSDANSENRLPDRRFNYPYVAWQFQQPQFVKRHNLFLMDQVEDVSLGHFFESRLGYANEALDSTEDATILHAQYRKGWQSARTLTLFKTQLDTIHTKDGFANTILRPQLDWFWQQSRKHTLYLSAKAALGDKLFIENQFLAGGNNGLRGYPLRMQSGNKRALFSAEQRFYPDWYPWRLLRIGAAAFVDVGSAWDDAIGEQPDWLGNAGIGLRILSTRQANAPVTHIDIAVPFDQRDDIDSVQVVVVSKAVF